MALDKNLPADSHTGLSYKTALAAIAGLREYSVLDLTEDDYNFLIGDKLWSARDRQRARRCIEAAVYGALDFVGFPRFAAPVEFIAAAIATFVRPVNWMVASVIMEGAEFCENIVAGVERPVSANEMFAHLLMVVSGNDFHVNTRDTQLQHSQSNVGS